MSYRPLKTAFIAIICSLLLIIAIAPIYIPEQKYHALVEHLISESLDRQVKISKLKYQLFPFPHIEGTNITIMSKHSEGEAVIGRLAAWFSYAELLKGRLQLNHLHFNGVATNQAFIESFSTPHTKKNSPSTRLISIKRISATSVSMRTHDNTLIGPFRFEGTFDNTRLFTALKVSLIDNNFHVDIKPAGEQRFKINITGRKLSAPQLSHLTIDQLAASGFYENNAIEFHHFDARAYEGRLLGTLKLKHDKNKDQWLASGKLKIDAMPLAPLNPPASPVKLSGRLSGQLNISAHNPSLLNLLASARTHGQLSIRQGHLQGPQLTLIFDELNTTVNFTPTQAHFTQLHAQLYGGRLSDVDVKISKEKIWEIQGRGVSKNLDSAALISHLFNEKSSLSGKLTATAMFSAQADSITKLARKLHVQGDLELNTPSIVFSSPKTITLNDLSLISADNFKFSPGKLSVKHLAIHAYQGVTQARDIALTWSKPWRLNASITTKQIALQPLLHQLGRKKYISGKLDSTFRLTVDAPSFETFFEHLDVAGKFTAKQGRVYLPSTTQTDSPNTFQFNTMHAEAFFDSKNLLMTALDIKAYEGDFHVKDFHLSNNETWSLYCEITANDINLEPFLRDTKNQRVLAGKAGFQTTLSLSAPELDTLTEHINAYGSFYVNEGIVFNTDIEHAAAITSPGRENQDTTAFSELDSQFTIKDNTIMLSRLRITSSNLTGSGEIVIHTNKNIEGSLDVALRSTGNLLKVPLNVSGTIDSPEFALTGGALVGSAVGTSVLGPGLGTFVGFQTGKIFTGISNLFSRNKK